MRERVLDAIYKKLDEDPNNLNLQKQINLLPKANICTIHSFCLDVIKNNFFELDISPNFRIGDEQEINLMKHEVLEKLLEKKYEEEENDFLKLVDCYAEYRGDENLQDLILKIYDFAISDAFPKDWLYNKLEMFNPKLNIEKDFSKTIWGQIIIKELKDITRDSKDCIKGALDITTNFDELKIYTSILEETKEHLRIFYNCLDNSWDSAYKYYIDNTIFPDWTPNRKITLEAKNNAKKLRDNGKKIFTENISKYLTYDSKSAFRDIFFMYEIIKNLSTLVLEFEEEFKLEKKSKNIIDFNDIEHYALNILVKKNEDGQYIPTEIARKYSEKFEEIAIDEYQDSNNVQEQILTSISRGNNIFTVGDVKQSIYRFRRACPELFLKKYNNYSLNGNEFGLKIKLFKNFRSRKNILDLTNSIFESIMSEELGEIDYTEEEFLNLGAKYEDNEKTVKKSEIYVIEKNVDEEDINISNDDEEEKNTVLEEIKLLKKEEIEAKFVAKKIKDLLTSKILVNDKKEGYREIKYKDIVILLRSTKFANIYERELSKINIPVFTDGSSDYLDTIEIQTIMNLLKIIDNPLDDIAVVTVLRSTIFGFTDNEIIEIRLINNNVYFWNSILEASRELKNEALKNKVIAFLEKINNWKNAKDYLLISELIWKIYVETGFFNYVKLMNNGSIRQANLKILFERAQDYEKMSYKGLFNFIRFVEKIKLGNSDFSSAKIIGENEDVVRIMSIHKSKGLEFPIVFLSNSNKKMNTEDLKGDILFHRDLGFGPKYINSERKIEAPTLAREAIKLKLRDESISEEMRILYVALTRAREKLIITSIRKNEIKEIENKKNDLNIYFNKKRINHNLLKNKTSYLDWIEYVIFNYEIQGRKFEDIEFFIVDSKSFINENEEEIETQKIDFSEYKDFSELERKLNWKYKYKFLSQLPIKTTVSTLKRLENENVDFFALNTNRLDLEEIIPKFLQKEKITTSRIGTLTHLVLQKIDFNIIKTEKDVNDFIDKLVLKKFIKIEEAQKISTNKIFKFLNSNFAKKIKKSEKIYKEKPFCIQIDSSEILNNNYCKGKILVQGIIDLYYEKENGNLVLIDYKTDFVEKNEKELIEKYKVQLDIYKKALEEGTNKIVEEVYIYSLYLNKEIKL